VHFSFGRTIAARCIRAPDADEGRRLAAIPIASVVLGETAPDSPLWQAHDLQARVSILSSVEDSLGL